MDTDKKIPFNDFAVLGYVIPGGTFLLSSYLFEVWLRKQFVTAKLHTPLYTLTEIISKNDFLSHWIGGSLVILGTLGAAYVCGHILASLSAFVFERALLSKGYRDPYETLLQFDHHTDRTDKPHTAGTYRGLFFWFNLYLIARFYHTISPSSKIEDLLVVCEVVLLVSIPLKIIYDFLQYKPQRALEAYGYTKLANAYARFLNNPYARYPLLVINLYLTYAFPLFYDLLSRFLANFLRTRESLGTEFANRYKELYEQTFRLNPNVKSSNHYWLSRLFVTENSPNLAEELRHSRSQYRFSRNLSASFYLSALYCYVSAILQSDIVIPENWAITFLLPVVLYCLSFVFLIQYFYLYENRYNRMVFRTFVLLQLTKVKAIAANGT